MNSSANYSKRAATRLQKLLDELGFPDSPLGRATALAAKLNIDQQSAIQLLSGITYWSFEDLHAICSAFEKDPGFFLDKSYAGPLPSDARVVASLDGGESLVWRTPAGFLLHPVESNPDVALKYLTVPPSTVKGFVPGELLLCAMHPHASRSLRINEYCVIVTPDAYEIMRCIDIDESSARFEPVDERIGAVSIRYPNNYEGVEKRARVVGTVIATIRAV